MASSRHEFPAFPFEPYPVQLHFMKELYAALEQGGIAIAESPTGTGKTLSLICSVLQWLQDEKQRNKSSKTNSNNEQDNEPDWLRDFSVNTDDIKTKHVKEKKRTPFICKKPSTTQDNIKDKDDMQGQTDDVDAFLLDDYDSSDEFSLGNKARKRKPTSDPHSSTDEDGDLEEEDEEESQKVFFCSRTHSQLSQFVKELQRTTYSSTLKAVTIGSRKSLCINPDVQKLGHQSRINERCLELQRNSSTNKKVLLNGEHKAKKKAKGCPFIKKKSLQVEFKEVAWESEVLDIEDLVHLGKRLCTCPYYGSRRMVPSADLVILPYQSLLHRSTRESIGVKLKGCVVVIDEAHNLVDSITNMHSCQITESQLKQVQSLLSIYLKRFQNMLSAGNRRYIQTLLLLIQAFLDRLSGNATHRDGSADSVAKKHNFELDGNEGAEMLTINDFLFSLNIDNINMFKLWQYMKDSKIVHKVSSYAERVCSEEKELDKDAAKDSLDSLGTVTSFHSLAELVLALMNADSDGRILVVPNVGTSNKGVGRQREPYVKFVMLNAAQVFLEVIEQTRAVVLAGGTMQPIEELRYRLYPNLKESQIHAFSCGHIVPRENVLAISVARGPTGKTFDFTYQSRSSPEMIEELGRVIFNLSLVVPEGMVVFLPSFEYEEKLHTAWKQSGILDKIQRKKRLFREPRDASAVDVTLNKYKDAITHASNPTSEKTGAVILCVVGGKMSEGINFSDGMGRCVVMVGLPYPSPSDPELVERMKFIDRNASGYTGKDYYENLCMKAVNQSIGRAIRHIGDYASILLVDARYTTASSITSGPVSKLPTWIKSQLITVTGGFGEVQKYLHQFFRERKDGC